MLESKNFRTRWTPEDTALLSQMWLNNQHLQEISEQTFSTFITKACQELGRDKDGIYAKLAEIFTISKSKSAKFATEADIFKEYIKNTTFQKHHQAMHIDNAVAKELERMFDVIYGDHGNLRIISAPTGTGKTYANIKMLKKIHENPNHVADGGNDKIWFIVPSYRLMKPIVDMLSQEQIPYVVLTGQNKLHKHQFDHDNAVSFASCPVVQSNKMNKTTFKKDDLFKNEDVITIPTKFKIHCQEYSSKKSTVRTVCQTCHYKHPFEVVKQYTDAKKPIVIISTIHKLFYNICDFNNAYRFDPNHHVSDFFQNSTFILDESTESYISTFMSTLDDVNIFGILNNMNNELIHKEFRKDVDVHVFNALYKCKNENPHLITKIEALEKSIKNFVDGVESTHYDKIYDFKDGQGNAFVLDKKIVLYGAENDPVLPSCANIFHSESVSELERSIDVNVYLHQNNTYSLIPIDQHNTQSLDSNIFSLMHSNINLKSIINYIFYTLVDINNHFTYFYSSLNEQIKKLELELNGVFIHEKIIKAIQALHYRMFAFENQNTFSAESDEEIDQAYFAPYAFINILNKNVANPTRFLTHRQSMLSHGFNVSIIKDKKSTNLSELHPKDILFTFSRYEVMPLLKAMRARKYNNNLILSSANANFDSIGLNPDLNFLCLGEKPAEFDNVYTLLEQYPHLSKDTNKNFDIEQLELKSELYINNELQVEKVAMETLDYLKAKNEPMLGVIYLNKHDDVKDLKYHLNKANANSNTEFIYIVEGAKAQYQCDKEIEKFKEKLMQPNKGNAPKLCIITAFATLSTGINLRLMVREKEYKQAHTDKNIWLYNYTQPDVQFLSDVAYFDINFYFNVVSKSFASGVPIKSLILHLFDNAIDSSIVQRFQKIKDESQITQFLKTEFTNVLSMLATFFQSLGRINRSFDSPRTTHILLSRDTPEIINTLGEAIWNYVPKTNMYTSLVSFCQNSHPMNIEQIQVMDGSECLSIFYKIQHGLNDALIRLDADIYDLIEQLRFCLTEMAYHYHNDINQTRFGRYKYHYAKRHFSDIKKDIQNLCNELNKKAEKYKIHSSMSIANFVIDHKALSKSKHLYYCASNKVLSNYPIYQKTQKITCIPSIKSEFLHPNIIKQIVYAKIDEDMNAGRMASLGYLPYNVDIKLNELSDGYFTIPNQDWLISIDHKSYALNHAIDSLIINNIHDIFKNFKFLSSKITTIQNQFNGKLCYVICINNEDVYPTTQRYAQVLNLNNEKEWIPIGEARKRKLEILSLFIIMTSEKLHSIKGNITYADKGILGESL